jgi:hypothetical protein
MDTLFAVERAVALILFLGCSSKAWIVKPPDDSTYPKYHTFCVPNTATATATVQDSQQGKVEGKKDVGDASEKAKRIFEMMCFGLLAGIPLQKGRGETSGAYTLQCSTCKVNLFKAVKITPSKTENNAEAETTSMFLFTYNCEHKQNDCCPSQTQWTERIEHSLVPLHFDTALIGACIWKYKGDWLLLPMLSRAVQLAEVRKALLGSSLGICYEEARKLDAVYTRLQKLLPQGINQQLLDQIGDDSSVLCSEQIMLFIFQAAFKQKSKNNSRPKKEKLNSSDNASGGSGLEATVPTGTSKRKRSPSNIQPTGTGTLTGSSAEHAPTSPPIPATDRSTGGIAANQQTRLSAPVEEIEDQPLDHPVEKDPPEDDQVIATVATILNPQADADAEAESVRQPKESELYTEEVDFLYSSSAGPDTSGEHLEAMLPSLAVEVPKETQAKWTFCEESRVMLVDFTGIMYVSEEDKLLYATWLQRDDVAMVSRGLVNIDPGLYSVASAGILHVKSEKDYSYFKCFDRVCDGNGKYIFKERSGQMKIEMTEFARYMQHRQHVLACDQLEGQCDPKIQIIIDGKETEIDACETSIYMLDCPMGIELVSMLNEFKGSMKIPEILPGGLWDMTNIVRFLAILPCCPIPHTGF